jgi:hypothetical protein
MEGLGESGRRQAVDPGGGQRQRHPHARLEVLRWARRRGESWRLAQPGRVRPPGGGNLGWA